MPQPLDPQDIPFGDSPWWTPLRHPVLVGEIQPRRTTESLARAAGVAMSAARGHRPEGYVRDTSNRSASGRGLIWK